MKKLLFALFCLPFALNAQQLSPGKTGGTVSLVCKIIGMPSNVDSFYLYEMVGLAKRPVARGVRRMPDSVFVFTIPASAPKFYQVGSNVNMTAPIILGQDKEVTLWGSYLYIDKSRAVGSPINTQWDGIRRRIDELRGQSDYMSAQYRSAMGAGVQPVIDRINKLAKEKTAFLDSVKTVNPFLAKLAALHINPDFKNDKGYDDAGDFVGREYFRNANLNDAVYADQPELFNAFKNYVAALAVVLPSTARMEKILDAQLAKVPDGLARRMALGGVVSGLQAVAHNLHPVYAKKYVDAYRNQSYGEIGPLEFEVRRLSASLIGVEAPDLAGMTPDSSSFSLRQLRGKVTLVDFWASWCGPCRRENPNVVAMYNKYKSKGFDILGVSLDSNGDRWRDAIKQDKLTWNHISDLGGWQSKHAQLYQVSSIPTTLLLDREGKIIARNLRGEQLETRLKEIFGE